MMFGVARKKSSLNVNANANVNEYVDVRQQRKKNHIEREREIFYLFMGGRFTILQEYYFDQMTRIY